MGLLIYMMGEFSGLGFSTHHRGVMCVRANLSKVFASYSFERREVF